MDRELFDTSGREAAPAPAAPTPSRRERAEENRRENLRRIEEATGRTEDDISSQLDHAVSHGVTGSRGEDSAVNESGQQAGFVEGAPSPPSPAEPSFRLDANTDWNSAAAERNRRRDAGEDTAEIQRWINENEPAEAREERLAANAASVPELDAEQEEIVDELQPVIQEAADPDSQNPNRVLTDEEEAEADRRAAKLNRAVRNVLGLTGDRGRDALRKIAHAIEAFASGWNGNPSQITEKIMEEYRAFRDSGIRQDEITHVTDENIRQADADRDFQREERGVEHDFQREMANFAQMTDMERMEFAHDLNVAMRHLEGRLGQAEFKAQLGAQFDDIMRLRNAVRANPNDWAAITRAMGGVGQAEHIINNISSVIGSVASVVAIAKP